MCDGKIFFNLIKINVLNNNLLKRQSASTVCSISGNKFNVRNGCTHSKKDTDGPFPSAYKSREVEKGWYEWWDGRGFFTFENQLAKSKVFSMVLPPPNVTGNLHLGHVLTCTIQDVLARWHRMCGDSVIWVPGLDHAGIATQVLVERKLWHEEHLTRFDVGREGFTQRVQKWKDQQANIIVEQLKRLGVSVDWSREFYTLDAKQTEAVTEAFIHLFDAGLIYRDCALVNWSCILQSAISDVEVEHRHFEKATLVEVPNNSEPVEFGTLTDFAYKLCETDGEVVVSTTRLETVLGDVAVAVHPHDPRYRNLQGAHVWNPFTKKKLPVVFDECVDMKLGTGALKITPAHNTIDFEVARRHNLEIIPVILEDGTLGENCAQFSGLKRFEARRRIHKAIEQLNLLRGHKDHAMLVPFCSRSGDVVELLLKPQWFVRCKTMAEEAAAAVQDGGMEIEPRRFEKAWYDWLYNIRDWCVSRQLWWGHQVPMYHCVTAGNMDKGLWVAASSTDQARRKAAVQLHLNLEEAEQLSIKRDEDVLDTWFSSALLPFSALGWPDQLPDFKKYYPLSLMETGHDILFFWVARMVMLGLQLTCCLPFERILLHGILCDAHGRKMSKSLGNVVSPDDVIFGISAQELQKRNRVKLESGFLSKSEFEKASQGQKKLFPNGIPECGADALRFTLVSHNFKNFFINFEMTECNTNSLFCNKLWQATRYTLLLVEKLNPEQRKLRFDADTPLSLGKYDHWILSRLAWLVQEVNQSLQSLDLHLATTALKSFIHMELCDVYVEATKLCTKSQEDSSGATAACQTLLSCLDTTLRCLSPFMPFLTEELYQRLPVEKTVESIMLAAYPASHQWEKWRDEDLEREMQTIRDMVSTIRQLKGAYLQTVRRPLAYFEIKNEAKKEMIQEHLGLMAHLTRCEQVKIVEKLPEALRTSVIANTVEPGCILYLQHEGQITVWQERASKIEKLSKELDRLLKMTASAGYREKASPQIQSTHMTKIETLKTELKRIENMKPTS